MPGRPRSTPTQGAPYVATDAALSVAIIEDADDAIIAKSLDGTVTTWNAGAERLFGYSATEMIGGPITRLFPPDRLHEEGVLIARVVLGKTISHFVTRRIRKDGAPIDVSVTLSPVRDASGTIVAVSKIARDITESQQRYLASALSAAIVEHSDDAIISKSLDGTVLTWNAGAGRIFGYTADEMIGGPITRLFPPERLHEEAELIAQLAHGKKISHFVTQRLRKNGTPIDVSVTLSPVRDASGKIVAISKIARDITEAYQRQLASALAAAIVEHSDDAIISKTLDGTVISWNVGAQQIFGYTATEMIGAPITRLLPDDRLTEEPELISQVLLGRTVDHFVTRRIRKDGTSIDVSVTVSPVRDVRGQIVAISKIARNITAVRQQHMRGDRLSRDVARLEVRRPSADAEPAVGQGTDMRTHANRAMSEKIDELVRNEQRFQTLVRLTSQVIWTTNPEGHFDSAQPGWAALTGQSFDDYQGVGWSAAVHPEDAQPTVDAWNRSIADRRPFLFEHRVRRHDGAYRTCTINAAPVLNEDGSIREWVGVHNDITERRQQDDAIRAQEAKFRFLTESLPQIVWTSRPDGCLDYYNQRYFSYTGNTPEQTQGWGWGPVLHPDDLQNMIRLWGHSVETGEPLETEGRLRRASDGTHRWHLHRAVPLRDARGAIVTWFGTSTDIHDYKEAEAKNLALQAELEDRVRERTAELARVGNIAGVGGWSITVPSGTLHWSDETCRILDVQPGHRPTLDEAFGLYSPAAREVIESACQDCMVNAVPFDVELPMTTAKGRSIWARAVGEAQMEQGTVVRIVGAFQDNTARKLAELALFEQHHLLRVANERFELAAEAAGIGVWEWDLSSKVICWDDQMYRLYGLVRNTGEEPYEQWTTSLHADDRGRAEQELNEARRDNATFDTEFRIVKPSGEIRHLKATAKIQTDGAGVATRMIGVNFDITARKKAELDLKQTSSLLRMVLNSANDLAIIATSPDLTIRVFNKGAERLTGYAGAEFIGRATPAVFHDAGEMKARGLQLSSLLGRSVQGADVFHEPTTLDVPWEWTFIRKDRRCVPVSLTVSAMFDDSGTLSGYIGVARDITRDREHDRSLQQAKSEAERANAAKSEFLANMSHEIRTPLNGVIGMTGLLLDTPLNPEQREYAQIARSSGDSLLVLVNNILDFSKIEAGHLELECIDFDLQGVIDETVDAVALAASEKGVEILVDVDPTCATSYRGDPTRLRQILLNLMSNAVKFTDTGDIVLTVRLTEVEAGRIGLAVSVADNGIGIPQDRIEKLFAPFTQADASTTRKHGGTGLGLSICRRLVEHMGGRIHVESAPGRGSVFRFEVMLDRGAAATPWPCLPVAGLIRALIVDVNPVSQRILADQLRRWDVHIVCAGTAEETLLRWSELSQAGQLPQVAFLGHQLGEHDGEWLATQIRRLDPDRTCHLVLMTSLARHLNRPGGRAFDRTITKPVKGRVLFRVLAELAGAGVPMPDAVPLAATGLEGRQVLLVDDNAVNQKVGERQLSRLGLHVTQAWNGLEALRELRQKRFDVVLMDCQMPEMDGYEATRLLRRPASGVCDTTVPVIAMTAHALTGDRDRCLAAGMDEYITKPIDAVHLLAALQRVLGTSTPIFSAQRAAHSDLKILDREALLRTCDADEAFVQDLLHAFLTSLNNLGSAIDAADRLGNLEDLRGFAHQMKGAALNVHAVRLAGAAAALELADAASLTRCLEEFRQVWPLTSQHVVAAIQPATNHGSALRYPAS